MPDSKRHRESHEDLCLSEKGVGLERWSLLREHTAFSEDLSSRYPETLSCGSQLSVASTPGGPNTFRPSGHLWPHAHSLTSTKFKIIKISTLKKKYGSFKDRAMLLSRFLKGLNLFFFFALLSLPLILLVAKTSISVYQNRR